LANLREAKEAWIDTAKALGRPVPEPQRGLERFSGKFTIRMPKSLHKNLANEAEREGVSLNQYVVYLLSDRHSSQSTSGVIEQAATDFYVESQTTVSKQIVRAANRDWFRRGDLASRAIPQRPVGDYIGIATREVLTRDRT
ncbi:MAG TPA: type II toxin-antitoxin system HicB family antitoxin, partial [Firmicutes bacterium]|nr:type II toxin-antitoxin system HicB family antitoxin [Bacillota bacterium]